MAIDSVRQRFALRRSSKKEWLLPKHYLYQVTLTLPFGYFPLPHVLIGRQQTVCFSAAKETFPPVMSPMSPSTTLSRPHSSFQFLSQPWHGSWKQPWKAINGGELTASGEKWPKQGRFRNPRQLASPSLPLTSGHRQNVDLQGSW